MTDTPNEDERLHSDLKAYFDITTSTPSPANQLSVAVHTRRSPTRIAVRGLVSAVTMALVAAVAILAVGLRSPIAHPATVSATPKIEGGAAMAYDAKTDSFYLFGGTGADGSPLAQTWQWTGSAWSLVQTDTSPPARTGAVMAYDPVSHHLIMTGGYGIDTTTTMKPSPPSGGCVETAGGSTSGGASGSGVTSKGVAVISGQPEAGVTTSGSVAGQPVLVSPNTAGTTSGSVSVSASGVTTNGPISCSQSKQQSLQDTWSFDGSTWHLESQSSSNITQNALRIATDTQNGSVVLLTTHFPQPQPCPLTATTANSTPIDSCMTAIRPRNTAYLWSGSAWQAQGPSFDGNISALATDPASGLVDAFISPMFTTGCMTVSSGTSASTNAPISCKNQAASESTVAFMQFNGSDWQRKSATGGPSEPVAFAAPDPSGTSIVVVTVNGQTWKLANDTWKLLTSSGPPQEAVALAATATRPASGSDPGQVLMFIGAPGLLSLSKDNVALFPSNGSDAVTEDSTWAFNGQWSKLSGPSWPPPQTPQPLPAPCDTTGAAQTFTNTSSDGKTSIISGCAAVPPAAQPSP